MGLSRGVPRRDIVASSHGLSCEYGCRDQRSRHDHFGHLSLHMVAEAKEALSSCCEERLAFGDISSRAFNEARAAVNIGSLDTTLIVNRLLICSGPRSAAASAQKRSDAAHQLTN